MSVQGGDSNGDSGVVRRALANAAAAAEGEVVLDDEPSAKELALRGRISLAELGFDPDDRVDPETDRALFEAIPEKTRTAIRYQWGRWLWWCGRSGRHHGDPSRPARPASLRQWIKDHERMRRKPRKGDDGVPQPYAYASVEQAVYLVCTVHKWMGHVSPAQADPRVKKQLEAYEKWLKARGIRARQAHPLTHEESVRIARSYDLTTVGGLRNACAFRLQFDAGCRPTEMLMLRRKDVWWEEPGLAVLRFVETKTREERLVGIEAVLEFEDVAGVVHPHPDADVDPEVLLGRWLQVLEDQGFGDPDDFVFHDVASGYPRADGSMAGRVLPNQWTYTLYEDAWNRVVRKLGIDRDPVTGKPRWVPSYANRAGNITRGAEENVPLERQAKRTGHSPQSRAITRYYRSGRMFGAENTGAVIRKAKGRQQVARGGGGQVGGGR